MAPAVYPCDLCKAVPGVRATDLYWTCQQCAELYLSMLEWERRSGTANFGGPWKAIR